MKFGFIAKHRGIWPAGWLCEALGVSRGTHAEHGANRRPGNTHQRGARGHGQRSFVAPLRRANAVAPGPIWTPLIPSTMPQDAVANFGKQVPMKRPGQPAESLRRHTSCWPIRFRATYRVRPSP
jgi:hypothetical protein